MSKKKKYTHEDTNVAQTPPEACDIAIIGGGAAGLACAVACAQEARAAGVAAPSVVVLEQGRRVGASIMRSGNGAVIFLMRILMLQVITSPNLWGACTLLARLTPVLRQ